MAKAKLIRQKIVIIGCGNVAWHIAKHLSANQRFGLFVYNHKENDALIEFKEKFECKVFSSLENITDDADFYLVCVSDSEIARIETRINLGKQDAIVMHTSGSVGLEALGERAHQSAAFYPLQTFSKGDIVNWLNVPIVIEADNEATRQRVQTFAKAFSNHIVFADYKRRLKIHLAAVMVNNFTNALYGAALELLNEKKNQSYNIQLLLPLIHQTTKKLNKMSPLVAQTGPAKRGDKIVIEKHLDLLHKHGELRKVYKSLTRLIQKQQHPHD